ncbi:hypothetical protein RIF29_40831 [Crotalaria pallida]|uniref:BAH domain-containing protein n=1 Tax=Crotalaria pallida TaxID=3830 RepID=A0AAN9E4E7_CROPI
MMTQLRGMSEEVAPVFVAWEERVECPERGKRVTHFYLKGASGDLVLAVVGTERSLRHMMYTVPDEFLQAYGCHVSIYGHRWRVRREVVDWLTSLTSQCHQLRAGVQLDDSRQSEKSLKLLKAGIKANKRLLPDKMISRKLKFQLSDIEWSGIASVCAKQLKHYPGFCRNRITINVHSFVYIMAQEERHYLGYVEDMYEDKRRHKKVKIRWIHYGQEVKPVVQNMREGEVFMTSHVQLISAECINGPATVLTPKHYEKYLAAVPNTSSSEIHVCLRQIKNNKLKPFALSKLRGYGNQSVLSCLDSPILSKRKAPSQKLHIEDDENFTKDDPLMSSSKRKRISEGYQMLEEGSSDLKNSAPLNEMTKCKPKYPGLKLKLSRKTMGIKVIGPKPQGELSFKVGDKIEVLCQDSGIRGCWFRCTVLTAFQKQLKVRYDDVENADRPEENADGPEKLEEWVPASRVANPDKLGMRCSGRLTVRPCPPKDTTDHTIEIGAAVDVWWCDGWWEGVITAVNYCGTGALQVYSPGEEKLLMVQKKNVRISRDWVGNKWVDIPGKPNICSFISSNVNSSRRQSANSAVVDGSKSDLESKPSSVPKNDVAQKVELELSVLETPDDLVESMKEMTLRKPLHAIHENKNYYSDSGCDGDDGKPLHAIDEDIKDNNSGGGSDGEAGNAVSDSNDGSYEGDAIKAVDDDMKPLHAIDEDIKDDNSGGGDEGDAGNAVAGGNDGSCEFEAIKGYDDDMKPLHAIDEDIKDNNSGGGSEGEAGNAVSGSNDGSYEGDAIKAVDDDMKPLHAIDEDIRDDNIGGHSEGNAGAGSNEVGCDSDDGNIDDDRKPLHAIDEAIKDNNSGGGSEGDTDNAGAGGNDAGNTEENSEENLKEKFFDYAEPKLDAAAPIQVA